MVVPAAASSGIRGVTAFRVSPERGSVQRSPPGPSGEPVFGSSRRYARDPFTFLSALEAAYGGVASFDLGPTETFVVTNPASIEEVLVSSADAYRKPDLAGAALEDLLGAGLLLSEGETWEQQRSLLAPAYGMDRLAGMADRITGHAEAVVGGWTDGDTVDVEAAMTHVTVDVILDVMMGVELPDERVTELQEALVPVGARFEPDPRRVAVPDWVPMPGDRRFREAVDTLDAVIVDILDRRRDTIGGDDDRSTDVVSLLVDATEAGRVSASQLRDELVTVLLAGHDTTALAVSYTLVLLAEHPTELRRVQREVDAVVGDDRPGIDHVREFTHLDHVLQEAMRMYPPVYTLFRTPTEPTAIDGYEVPESANVMLPQWAVHRSDRYWESPSRFDPDRFGDDRRATRPTFAFFPFGGGPRRCIGSHLAMIEAALILATVLQRFDLEFHGSLPLALQPSITAHPRDALEMTITAREPG